MCRAGSHRVGPPLAGSVAPVQLAIGHGCGSRLVAAWKERQTDASAGCVPH